MKIEKNHHIIFLFILSLNYLIPLLIFGEITLFYIDSLDSEVVMNYIIGQHYSGNNEAIKSLLGGSIKIEFLRRLYQPISLLYSIFSPELAYWIIDVMVKLTGYLSFYLFAKKINKNLIFCALAAAIYASLNIYTHEGFSLAVFPYILYLIFFKNKISIKHFFIIFIFALNSDIFRGTYIFLVTLMIAWVYKNKYEFFLKNYIKIILIFLPTLYLVNFNTFHSLLFDGPFHREEFLYQGKDIVFVLKDFFFSIFSIPSKLNYEFGLSIGALLIALPIIILSFVSKNKEILKILTMLILIKFSVPLLSLNGLSDIRNELFLARIISFQYIDMFSIFLYSFLLILLLKENVRFSKILLTMSLLSLFTFQISSSIGPLYKKYFSKNESFRNFYTFNGFYYPEAYKKVKVKVGDSRIFSVGLDPMAANMNGINTIDGYFPMYLLDYKKRFYKVIKDELDQNSFWKNYFINWGSRVYVIIDDAENLKINFDQAKNLNAKFVLSGFPLKSEKLESNCENCENDGFYLYEIK